MQIEEKMEALRRINPAYFDFLVQWQGVVLYFVFGFLALAVIVYILHKVKIASFKEPKDKYEYISKYEIKRLFLVQLLIAIALAFFINHLEWETIAKNYVWFIMRMVISIAIAILHGYVAKLLLKFWWPKVVGKKLRRLRYTPRINPKTGNKMKLLSEEEEDVYLDEGMQAEEDVFSVDYDVWIDQETGDTHIEKYDGRLTAEECDRCGFLTLQLHKEQVIKRATAEEDGELEKEFKCSYCGREKKRTVRISRTMERDMSSARLIEDPLEHMEKIVLIKIDIKSSAYNLLSYEFKSIRDVLKSQDMASEGYGIEEVKIEIFTKHDEHLKFVFDNLPEARKFLKEFDLHNVAE